MDCCGQGHTLAPRHWMWSTTLTSIGAMLAGDVGPTGSTTAARTAETFRTQYPEYPANAFHQLWLSRSPSAAYRAQIQPLFEKIRELGVAT